MTRDKSSVDFYYRLIEFGRGKRGLYQNDIPTLHPLPPSQTHDGVDPCNDVDEGSRNVRRNPERFLETSSHSSPINKLVDENLSIFKIYTFY